MRILTHFPFASNGRRSAKLRVHNTQCFRCSLRTDSLTTNYSSCQTLTHFDPRVSHSCICYYIQDLHLRQLHAASQLRFNAIETHAYSRKTIIFLPWPRISGGFERNPFSGQDHSAGKLLHTSQMVPTSMDTFQLSKYNNTFNHYNTYLDKFNSYKIIFQNCKKQKHPVHPVLPFMLTTNGPLN